MTERNMQWFAMKTVEGHAPRLPCEDLPAQFRVRVESYIYAGYMPGIFLKAVLENDLQSTLIYATREEKADLESLVMWLQNFVPGYIWRREGVVEEWVTAMEKAKGEANV